MGGSPLEDTKTVVVARPRGGVVGQPVLRPFRRPVVDDGESGVRHTEVTTNGLFNTGVEGLLLLVRWFWWVVLRETPSTRWFWTVWIAPKVWDSGVPIRLVTIFTREKEWRSSWCRVSPVTRITNLLTNIDHSRNTLIIELVM